MIEAKLKGDGIAVSELEKPARTQGDQPWDHSDASGAGAGRHISDALRGRASGAGASTSLPPVVARAEGTVTMRLRK
jgi:hypothetical protein